MRKINLNKKTIRPKTCKKQKLKARLVEFKSSIKAPCRIEKMVIGNHFYVKKDEILNIILNKYVSVNQINKKFINRLLNFIRTYNTKELWLVFFQNLKANSRTLE